jgi:hypothetical protein
MASALCQHKNRQPAAGLTMWVLTTSDGRRITDICSEFDARRIVHSLGTTQLRGPYSWDVKDNQGQSFVAEIRHRQGSAAR